MRIFRCLFILFMVEISVLQTNARTPNHRQNQTPVFELKGPAPVLHVQGKTIAEVVYATNGTILLCRLHELDEEYEAEVIIKNSSLPVKYPSFKGMMNLIDECSKFPLNSSLIAEDSITMDAPAIDFHMFSSWSLWRGILPGTKWCGMGDIASSYEDLGEQYKVDKCCRAHDLCPIKLKSFRTGYDLVNFSFYTKSHCDCDNGFYNCLKDVQTDFADVVGNFYFNIMRIQCLKSRQSFVCIQNSTDTNGNTDCVRWEVDPNNVKMQMTLPLRPY